MMKYFLLLFISSFIISCTVQKRLHQPGWNVEWKKKYLIENDSKSVTKYNLEDKGGDLSNYASDSIIDSNVMIKTTTDELVQFETIEVPPMDVLPNVSKLKNYSYSLENGVLFKTMNTKNRFNDTKVKTNLNLIELFILLGVVIVVILLAAGICAIIFGNHWIWLVLGILLVVLGLMALIGMIGSLN